MARVKKKTYLIGTLASQLKGDLQASQIEKRFDTHEVGGGQQFEKHVAVNILLRNELLVPFLVHHL